MNLLAAVFLHLLDGARIEPQHRWTQRVAVVIEAGRSVCLAVDPSRTECVLHVDEIDKQEDWARIYEDGLGRKIVRVQQKADRVSLHFDDGEVFHVLAVRNEEGLRVATREEREHGTGPKSLVDRVLGRFM